MAVIALAGCSGAPGVTRSALALLLDKLGQDDKGSYRLSEVEEQAVAPHRDTADRHGRAPTVPGRAG
ncbi:hypothetical protein ACWEO4_30115 [Streptomyces sp. NPDC004393]